MSLHEYKYAKKLLAEYDPPFYALLFALIRKADDRNIGFIRALWPEKCAEFEARYHSRYHPATGVLPEDGIPPDRPLPEIEL